MATLEAPKPVLLRAMFPWLTDTAWAQVREYAPTLLTEFTVMASQILLYKLAAHYLGKTGFSEYALARRTVSLLFPIPVLGLAVGLPRYLGFTNGRGDSVGALRYYGATLWCVTATAFTCFILLNSFAGPFAYLFFGDSRYRYLAFPLSLMILGQCIHTIVCGYFRGHILLTAANVLQTINLGIVPIVSFLVFGHSLTRVLTAMGLISLLTAGGGLLFTPVQAIVENSRKETKELLRYGIQRVPGDFILVALFTLPATFVAHLKGIEDAGFVAFGVSIVTMVGAAFAPIGLVLLPKATFMLAEGARAELRGHLFSLLRITAGASLAIVVVLWIFMPNLIGLYLGTSFEQAVPIARLLIIGALPYSIYLLLRNIVDAYHEYGVTAAILSCGLVVFLTGSYFGQHTGNSLTSILASFLIALAGIALLSNLECSRIFRLTDTRGRA